VLWFLCYDNIHVCKLIALCTANAYNAEMSVSACTRCVPGQSCSLTMHWFCLLSCEAMCNTQEAIASGNSALSASYLVKHR